MKLKDLLAKEEMAKKLAVKVREKSEAAQREALYLKGCAEEEAIDRREAEMNVVCAAKRNEKLEIALRDLMPQYHNITWDEIVSATSSFSDELKIGTGACGAVYKCSLYHTTVAVKVLHSKEKQSIKQLQQEVCEFYKHVGYTKVVYEA